MTSYFHFIAPTTIKRTDYPTPFHRHMSIVARPFERLSRRPDACEYDHCADLSKTRWHEIRIAQPTQKERWDIYDQEQKAILPHRDPPRNQSYAGPLSYPGAASALGSRLDFVSEVGSCGCQTLPARRKLLNFGYNQN